MPHEPALEAHEQREHAEHALHERDPFISRVSITIAVLAVLAAATGSLENIEAAGAITASSEAVLAQNRASDTWSEYQAESLKNHLYGLFADEGGPDALRYRQTAARQRARRDELKPRAIAKEQERDALLKVSRERERRHYGLAAAATLLETGIAVCTVAIITRKRTFWFGSLALAAGGLMLLALTYLR